MLTDDDLGMVVGRGDRLSSAWMMPRDLSALESPIIENRIDLCKSTATILG